MDKYELFIVGAGAAGMSAAVAAWEAGCKSILLADRSQRLGGILPQCLHRGFGEELTGPEYSRGLEELLGKTGVEAALETSVISVSGDKSAVLSSKSGLRRVDFRRMILSAGCREIPIGALDIAGTRPAGIFTAGQAQELINLRRQRIGSEAVIIGSGDLGMIIARRFILEGGRVAAIIEKKPQYGGMARNYHRCIEDYAIPLVCSAQVTKVLGQERVRGVTVRRSDTGAEEFIPCDTLIVAAGLTPERSLIDGLGSPPWLSLCGNCSKIHDVVDSAVEEARRAGASAAGKKEEL